MDKHDPQSEEHQQHNTIRCSYQFRQQLHSGRASEESGMKEKAVAKITEDQNVPVYWSIACEEEEADVLLWPNTEWLFVDSHLPVPT